MKTETENGLCLRLRNIVVAATVVSLAWGSCALAYPVSSGHSSLKGPWELAVRVGKEGRGVTFPVTVADANSRQKLDSVLPLMETPIQIRVDEYVPDLKWETTAVKQKDAGVVVKLRVKGANLDQQMWLDSQDPARQSISSASLGSVMIYRLQDAKAVEPMAQELAGPKAVGILSIWPEDSNSPLEYVAVPGKTVTVPGTKHEVRILEYVPHYSMDTDTKVVTSMSKKPINPAIKVSIGKGNKADEQWLWAKFPSFPHKEMELPLRMKFTSFDLGGAEGKYILITAKDAETWVLFVRDGKTQVEKVRLGEPYPFADKAYSFSIEEIIPGAVVKTDWKNNSESLAHPALIVTIEEGKKLQQAVLEFRKPYHYRTGFGTMVLVYRPRAEASGMGGRMKK